MPGFHTTTRELNSCTFEGPGASKTPPKFHEEAPRETQKERDGSGRGKKKARNFGPPTLRGAPFFWVWGLHLSGPPPFCVWEPPFGAPPFGRRAQRGPPRLSSQSRDGWANRLKHQFWPKSSWPKSATQILAKVGQLRLAKVGQNLLAKVGLAKVGQKRMAKVGMAKVGIRARGTWSRSVVAAGIKILGDSSWYRGIRARDLRGRGQIVEGHQVDP